MTSTTGANTGLKLLARLSDGWNGEDAGDAGWLIHCLSERLQSTVAIGEPKANALRFKLDIEELKELNADFLTIYRHMNRMMVRTKARLLREGVEKRRADLVGAIERVFHGMCEIKACDLSYVSTPLNMDFDPPRFESALLELLYNARTNVPDVERLHMAVDVTLFQASNSEWVRIVVSDNGPGIPEKFKERVFDLFFSRRPHGQRGTGVGLHFVRRVVRAHGGTIREVGTEGQDARFCIELPRYSTITISRKRGS